MYWENAAGNSKTPNIDTYTTINGFAPDVNSISLGGNNETYQALDDNMKKMTKEVKDKIWIPTVLTLDIGILSPILVDENMFSPGPELPG